LPCCRGARHTQAILLLKVAYFLVETWLFMDTTDVTVFTHSEDSIGHWVVWLCQATCCYTCMYACAHKLTHVHMDTHTYVHPSVRKLGKMVVGCGVGNSSTKYRELVWYKILQMYDIEYWE
jgi:hypothetical protein